MITACEVSVLLPCQITHFRFSVREMAVREWMILNSVLPKDMYGLTR